MCTSNKKCWWKKNIRLPFTIFKKIQFNKQMQSLLLISIDQSNFRLHNKHVISFLNASQKRSNWKLLVNTLWSSKKFAVILLTANPCHRTLIWLFTLNTIQQKVQHLQQIFVAPPKRRKSSNISSPDKLKPVNAENIASLSKISVNQVIIHHPCSEYLLNLLPSSLGLSFVE